MSPTRDLTPYGLVIVFWNLVLTALHAVPEPEYVRNVAAQRRDGR